MATVDDWPRLWPIWRDVVAAGDTYTYDPGTSSDDARAAWGGGSPGHETWLAEAVDDPVPGDTMPEDTLPEDPVPGDTMPDETVPDHTVLGMYRIAPNQPGPGRHVANGSYMVAPAVRGTGVGRTLVEHSLRRCTEIGFRAIQFNAVAESNTGAIALYERLGFTTVGIVPDAFAHPRLGFVGLRVMHRFLA